MNCRFFKIDNSSNICIEDCMWVFMLYNVGNKLCKFCDEECLDSCYGEVFWIDCIFLLIFLNYVFLF